MRDMSSMFYMSCTSREEVAKYVRENGWASALGEDAVNAAIDNIWADVQDAHNIH